MASDPVARLLLAVIAVCMVALTAAQFSGAGAEQEAGSLPPWTDDDEAVGYYEQRFQIFPVRSDKQSTLIVRTDQWTGAVDTWDVNGASGWRKLSGEYDEAEAARLAEEAKAAAAQAAAEREERRKERQAQLREMGRKAKP